MNDQASDQADHQVGELTMRRLAQSEAAGHGDKYFPAMLEVIDPH